MATPHTREVAGSNPAAPISRGPRFSQGSASGSRRPLGHWGRVEYRTREPFHPAAVRRQPEPASQLPATSPELRTCPRSRPPPGKNGHAGASRLPPQRLLRPLQALRTSPACDRACRTWRTTCRCRRATLLELPALASARRSAQAGRGARVLHGRWAVRNARRPEPYRWSRAQNGPVEAVPPPAASVSSVSSVPRYFLPELIFELR
jgi:hypothetical protein